MHYGAFLVGVLAQALGCQHQFAYRLDVVAQLEPSGMLHGTAHLHYVAVAGTRAVDFHHVLVGQGKGTHLEFVNGMDAVL